MHNTAIPIFFQAVTGNKPGKISARKKQNGKMPSPDEW
jgi:hypothetical protein